METSIASVDREQIFQDLVEDVFSRRMQPEDKYEIAAYLESIGWNDIRAASVFGAEDIFELAESIWDSMQHKITAAPFLRHKKKSSPRFILETVRNFLRGMIFALPMAVSVAAMLTLGFSLWSYENLGIDDATSIAIGTILSFMVVGGFTQSIARRGFFYLTQGYYNMGRRMTFIFVRIGFATCFIISAVILLFNLIFEVFPHRMLLFIILYFFFLSSIWLAVTVMYILRRELTFTALIACGILIVAILVLIFGIEFIIQAQIIALTIVAAAGIIMVFYYFKTAEGKMEKGIAATLPRMSIVLYSVLPYFTYGFLYFTFLYTDRLIAWSTNDQSYMPYLIWFRGHYELGLDFGLLTLMIPMGFVEVVVNNLMMNLEADQNNYLAKNSSQMHAKYVKAYFKNLAVTAAAAAICAVGVYFLVKYVDANFSHYFRTSFIKSDTTHFVFIVSLVGYSVLAVSLMNSIIMFSFSQPEMVNRVLFKALLLNVIVGFLCSRWAMWLIPWLKQKEILGSDWSIEGYSFAVFGLVAGAIMFFVYTTHTVIKVLSNIDYYLYAGS